MSELEALRQYADLKDADAFRTLVHRYQRLVYAACRRHLRDPSDIEDATQETFLKLARNAQNVRIGVASWLHRCATNTSLDLIRRDHRRRKHERAAAAEGRPVQTPWDQVEPQIDAALAELADADRELILNYFYAGRTQGELAAEHRVSQATVCRRVEVAVSRLRELVALRGVEVPASAFSALLAADAAEVPAGVAASLQKIGLAGLGQHPTPAARIAWSLGSGKAKSAALAFASVLAVAGVVAVGIGPDDAQPAGAAPAAPASDRPLPDPQLAGEWVFEGSSLGGRRLGMQITGEMITDVGVDLDEHGAPRIDVHRLRILRIVPTTEPKQIDVEVLEAEEDPQFVGMVAPGIYEVRDGVLRIALAEPGLGVRSPDFNEGGKNLVLTRYRLADGPAPENAQGPAAAAPELLGHWSEQPSRRMTFTADRITAGDAEFEITAWDPAADPKTMDLRVSRHPNRGARGSTMKLIYRVEGGAVEAGMFAPQSPQAHTRPRSFDDPGIVIERHRLDGGPAAARP